MSRPTPSNSGCRAHEHQPLLPSEAENHEAFFATVKKYNPIPYLWPPWVASYRTSMIQADVVGAISVASLYIPLCFLFATIAHVPPSSSLYAFVFHPLVYALIGSSSLMIVGPEATGSLLVGAAVKRIVDKDEGAEAHAAISGVATALAGVMLCGASALRLGFVDNILSRPLMKGFIGGVGLTLVIEQVVPGLGLHHLEQEFGADEGPPLVKLCFLVTNAYRSQLLSSVFFLSCLNHVNLWFPI